MVSGVAVALPSLGKQTLHSTADAPA